MPSMKPLGKLYLSFIILGGLVFLIQKVSMPMGIPLDSNIITSTLFSIQSALGNIEVKKLAILVLLLYTIYVGIESLVFLRDCAAWLYFKHKKPT